jgi:CubicO group peptidase (beta-lactamase class C family)
MNINLTETIYSPIQPSTDVIVYKPRDDFIKTFLTKTTDRTYKSCFERTKYETSHLSKFGKNHVFTLLGSSIAQINTLQKQGVLDGEILIAQGNQPLFHLINRDIEGMKEPQFMIASVSKQFFAIALLKALYDCSNAKTEETRILEVKSKLHAPISLFLPANSSIWSGHPPSWAQTISLHHLLTHTSGLPNYTELDRYDSQITSERKFCELPHSSAEMLQLISTEPFSFPPGTQYSYSNTGYHMVAVILEAITKKSASRYIQEAIFDPLGLTSTTCPSKGRWDELKQQSQYLRLVPQYKYDISQQSKVYPETVFEDLSNSKGDGSIISSAKDLLTWNQALHKKQSILPKPLYTIFTSVNLENYGYGIEVKESNLGTVLSHSGSIGTHRTLLCYYPNHDISIILLGHISSDLDKIETEVNALLSSLQETIPDVDQRNKTASTILSEKYPYTRGIEMIADLIQNMMH